MLERLLEPWCTTMRKFFCCLYLQKQLSKVRIALQWHYSVLLCLCTTGGFAFACPSAEPTNNGSKGNSINLSQRADDYETSDKNILRAAVGLSKDQKTVFERISELPHVTAHVRMSGPGTALEVSERGESCCSCWWWWWW